MKNLAEIKSKYGVSLLTKREKKSYHSDPGSFRTDVNYGWPIFPKYR